ncbi:MAG: TatD family hydrolase [Pseudomonadota bacterium]
MLIDSHCHIDVPEFDTDRDAVLSACARGGVAAIVVPGVRLADFPSQKAVCDESVQLHPAYGLHPVYLDEHRSGDVAALGDWLRRERPVAVGEIGLDYFVEALDRERQQRLFEDQLALAKELDLPVILHVRRSHDAVLATLRRFRLPRGGICHAFAGSADQAAHYRKLGFLLGFGGAATHERARRLRAVLHELPLESIALETDAPDIPPAFLPPGGRNSPEFLPRIAALLAEVRGVPVAELARVSSASVSRLLDLPHHAEHVSQPVAHMPPA